MSCEHAVSDCEIASDARGSPESTPLTGAWLPRGAALRLRATLLVAGAALLLAAAAIIATTSWHRATSSEAVDQGPVLMLDANWVDSCTNGTEDCSGSKCCQDHGTFCYQKNEYYSMCRQSCTPGVQEGDLDKSNWTCIMIDRIVNWTAAWAGEFQDDQSGIDFKATGVAHTMTRGILNFTHRSGDPAWDGSGTFENGNSAHITFNNGKELWGTMRMGINSTSIRWSNGVMWTKVYPYQFEDLD